MAYEAAGSWSQDDTAVSLRSSREETPLDPKAILTSIGEVVYDWNLTTDHLTWGANVSDVLTGIDVERLHKGRDFFILIEPGTGRSRHEAILNSKIQDQGTGVVYRTRYALRAPGKRLLLIEDTGRWFAGADGRPALAHGVIRVENSDLKNIPILDEEGRESCESRVSLIALIRSELNDPEDQAPRPLSLLVAAIDGLDRLNAFLGHEAVDNVISSVMSRLRSVLRRRDKLIRYSGNRFGLLLGSCQADQIEAAALRFTKAVEEEPITLAYSGAGVKLRLGGAVVSAQTSDAASLLRQAEEALEQASREGEPSFVLHQTHKSQLRTQRSKSEIGLDILGALNERRLVLARQPIVEAASRKPAFYEALTRVRRTDGMIAGAAEVIPHAERTGLIAYMDRRVLELASDHLATHPEDRLSINVSPTTIEDPEWLTALAAHLGRHRGINERLIIEITETAAVSNPDFTRAKLNAMKALGVSIAIDDFGAGHTSFRHLRHFPIDILKIDGVFIQNIARSKDDRFFVRTLIDLAHHLGLVTVAEWVENEETARILTDWGVDYLQGDYCGKPAIETVEAIKSDIRVA